MVRNFHLFPALTALMPPWFQNFANLWFEDSCAYHIRGMKRHHTWVKSQMCLAPCHLYKWYCRGTGIHYGNFREGSEHVPRVFIAVLHISFCSPSKHFSVLLYNTEKLYISGETVASASFSFNDLCFSLGAWTPWVLSKWYSGQVFQTVPRWSDTACSVHGKYRVSHFVPTHMAFVF